ncbi:hypothetical protein HDU91_000868 [Kappamyces sp. JEL0680]|nr:hypothetical protein HDU91_000868 [Kappamyces sp. JEL0680]
MSRIRPLICPSILSADFALLAQEAARMKEFKAHYLHVDVMDGHFVPNLTLGAPIVKSLRKHTDMFLDCHLMVTDPEFWVDDYAKAGANQYTFHIEAPGLKDPKALIAKIKAAGMKAAIALKPATPVTAIEDLVPLLDLVLVMTVEPGFGGQKIKLDCLEKAEKVKDLRSRYPALDIQVDGGIDSSNIELVASYGANVIVSGTGVFGHAQPDPALGQLGPTLRFPENKVQTGMLDIFKFAAVPATSPRRVVIKSSVIFEKGTDIEDALLPLAGEPEDDGDKLKRPLANGKYKKCCRIYGCFWPLRRVTGRMGAAMAVLLTLVLVILIYPSPWQGLEKVLNDASATSQIPLPADLPQLAEPTPAPVFLYPLCEDDAKNESVYCHHGNLFPLKTMNPETCNIIYDEMFRDLLVPVSQKRVFSQVTPESKLEIVLVELKAVVEPRIIPTIYNIANIYGGRGVPLTVVVSKEQKGIVDGMIEKEGWTGIRVVVLDTIYNVDSYSLLLESESFWKHFYGEYVLITQTDVMIFKEIGKEFFGFDYIGAPWIHVPSNPSHPQVGNGGYSMRRLAVMLEYSDFKSVVKRALADRDKGVDLPSTLSKRNRGLLEEFFSLLAQADNSKRDPVLPEDVFWADRVKKLPDEELAAHFALEWRFIQEIPTAMHKLYLRDRMGNLFRAFVDANPSVGSVFRSQDVVPYRI